MCEHGKGHMISHCSTCIGHDWFRSTCAGMMEHSFTINTHAVKYIFEVSYHIYKDGWDAPIGEVLYCEQEIRNRSDPCAVSGSEWSYPQSYCLSCLLAHFLFYKIHSCVVCLDNVIFRRHLATISTSYI